MPVSISLSRSGLFFVFILANFIINFFDYREKDEDRKRRRLKRDTTVIIDLAGERVKTINCHECNESKDIFHFVLKEADFRLSRFSIKRSRKFMKR